MTDRVEALVAQLVALSPQEQDAVTDALVAAEVTWGTTVNAGRSRLDEVQRLRALIDRDRTGLAAALAGVRKLAQGWQWLGEDDHWGAYSYEEHTVATLRRETGAFLGRVLQLTERALRESGHRANSAFHPSEPDREAEIDALRSELSDVQEKLAESLRWIATVQPVAAMGWEEAMKLRARIRELKEQLQDALREATIERETSAWEERCCKD